MNQTTYSPRKYTFKFVLIAMLIGLSLSLVVIKVARMANEPPGWRQSNIDGFGDPKNYNLNLEVFNNQLYAGTWHSNIAQVWRTSDGQSWSPLATSWTVSNTTILDMEPFGTNLYVGIDSSNGAQIWRTNGTTWELAASNGFTSTNNSIINAMAVFSNTIYAATSNLVTGIQIWRSPTGNSGSWTKVYTAGPDATGENGLTMLDVYSNTLFLGIGRNNIAELWRTSNGISWTPVFTNGFGNINNSYISAFGEFNGSIYIGLRNVTSGGEVWRSSNGTQWENVITGGLGKPTNSRPYGLIAYDNRLYLVFANTSVGAEVWRTSDGNAWDLIASGGWGDSNNKFADYLDKGAEVFKGSLYIGTGNDVTGVEVWQLLHQILLPTITRN